MSLWSPDAPTAPTVVHNLSCFCGVWANNPDDWYGRQTVQNKYLNSRCTRWRAIMSYNSPSLGFWTPLYQRDKSYWTTGGSRVALVWHLWSPLCSIGSPYLHSFGTCVRHYFNTCSRRVGDIGSMCHCVVQQSLVGRVIRSC